MVTNFMTFLLVVSISITNVDSYSFNGFIKKGKENFLKIKRSIKKIFKCTTDHSEGGVASEMTSSDYKLSDQEEEDYGVSLTYLNSNIMVYIVPYKEGFSFLDSGHQSSYLDEKKMRFENNLLVEPENEEELEIERGDPPPSYEDSFKYPTISPTDDPLK